MRRVSGWQRRGQTSIGGGCLWAAAQTRSAGSSLSSLSWWASRAVCCSSCAACRGGGGKGSASGPPRWWACRVLVDTSAQLRTLPCVYSGGGVVHATCPEEITGGRRRTRERPIETGQRMLLRVVVRVETGLESRTGQCCYTAQCPVSTGDRKD